MEKNKNITETAKKPSAEDHSKWCIFEQKICRYAWKNGPVFECTCPSDEEMPCN